MLKLLVAGFCLMTVGCTVGVPLVSGSGNIVAETRQVSGFTAVDLGVPANLEIRRGDVVSFEITMDDNLLPMVTSQVKDDVLQIKSDRNLAPSKTAKILITVPKVTSVSVAGSGRVSVEELSGPDARLSLAGASDMTAGVKADALRCEIAGSGTIKVNGTSKTVSISVAGSGDIDSHKLIADDVTVDIAGSGTIVLHAEKTLKVSIAGSGDIEYSGNPAVEQSIAGSGTVKARPAAKTTTPEPAATPDDPPATEPPASVETEQPATQQ